LNNISNLKNNSPAESRRITKNPTFICIDHEYIKNKENSNKRKSWKTFLGKKTKNYRKKKKKRKIKPLFITNQTDEKLRSNINNISQDNKTILSNENSYSTESNFSNKAAENIYLFEKIFPKTEKPKALYTNKNYELFKTSKEEIKKKGKWSYDEHIKFIKAYVNFGKDYVLIQKYIGSRNSTQIISHAQKFFKKLKKLKNNDFDFSDDNIKTLWDIFQLIEAKNKNNIDKEKYIINTLISLSQNIPINKKNEYNLLNGDVI
jgi:SHAQKYF class myb-like DNA-binding protein